MKGPLQTLLHACMHHIIAIAQTQIVRGSYIQYPSTPQPVRSWDHASPEFSNHSNIMLVYVSQLLAYCLGHPSLAAKGVESDGPPLTIQVNLYSSCSNPGESS